MPVLAKRIEHWPLDRLIPYARNARTHSDEQVAQIAASIKEFGFTNPLLVDTGSGIIAGHGRLLAARKLGLSELPVIVLDHLTETQRRAYMLVDNRLALSADWDDEMLKVELQALQEVDFDLDLLGFDTEELDGFLNEEPVADEDAVLAPPETPITVTGDLWLLGKHRLLCGDSTSKANVDRVLNGAQPGLMITDPPYGIELDTEWRDRAGLNGCGAAEPSYMKGRTEGHRNTSISSDTRADWSEAFELVPSIQVAYVWHASIFTREVLDGLLRIGFLYPQQLIWNKGRTVLTRTHYWYQHEPCWYVRRKNAPWFGKPGENSTIWDSPSPKFIMGGSGEEKWITPPRNRLN